MEREQKLEIVIRLMAKEFKITEEAAKKIISYLDIEDVLYEYYEEELNAAEEKQMSEWQEEIKNNHGIYSDDIHGGV